MTLLSLTDHYFSIVLTAAHCKGAFLDGVYIGGTDLLGSGSEYFEVLAELPHPDYGMCVCVLSGKFVITFSFSRRNFVFLHIFRTSHGCKR